MPALSPLRHPVGAQMSLARAQTRMLDELRAQGIRDERVLAAMGKVPRHAFIDSTFQKSAYDADVTLPIGHGQTLSRPRVVARMTEALLQVRPTLHRVLEVGTGSGYQAAVLAQVCDTVFTVERIKALSEGARARLQALGTRNVHCGYADGSDGWSTFAPYDGVLVTAGAEAISPGLLAQLSPGAAVVAPVGAPQQQQLLRLVHTPQGWRQEVLEPASFVPLLSGKA